MKSSMEETADYRRRISTVNVLLSASTQTKFIILCNTTRETGYSGRIGENGQRDFEKGFF